MGSEGSDGNIKRQNILSKSKRDQTYLIFTLVAH